MAISSSEKVVVMIGLMMLAGIILLICIATWFFRMVRHEVAIVNDLGETQSLRILEDDGDSPWNVRYQERITIVAGETRVSSFYGSARCVELGEGEAKRLLKLPWSTLLKNERGENRYEYRLSGATDPCDTTGMRFANR